MSDRVANKNWWRAAWPLPLVTVLVMAGIAFAQFAVLPPSEYRRMVDGATTSGAGNGNAIELNGPSWAGQFSGGLAPSIMFNQRLAFGKVPADRVALEAAWATLNAKLFTVELDLKATEKIAERTFFVEELFDQTWQEWVRYSKVTVYKLSPAAWKWPDETTSRDFIEVIGPKLTPAPCQSMPGTFEFQSGTRKGKVFDLRSLAEGVAGPKDAKQTVCVVKIPVYSTDAAEDGTITLKMTRWADYSEEQAPGEQFIFNLDYMDISHFQKGVRRMRGVMYFADECPKFLWTGSPDKENPSVIALSPLEAPLLRLGSDKRLVVDKRSRYRENFSWAENDPGIWRLRGKEVGKRDRCTIRFEAEGMSSQEIPLLAFWPQKDPYEKSN